MTAASILFPSVVDIRGLNLIQHAAGIVGCGEKERESWLCITVSTLLFN